MAKQSTFKSITGLTRSRSWNSALPRTNLIISWLRNRTDAETYHQDFAAKNPRHGYIVRWDAPKVAALKRLYPALYRAEFRRN